MADLSSRQRAHVPTLPTANSSYYRALRALSTAQPAKHMLAASGQGAHVPPLPTANSSYYRFKLSTAPQYLGQGCKSAIVQCKFLILQGTSGTEHRTTSQTHACRKRAGGTCTTITYCKFLILLSNIKKVSKKRQYSHISMQKTLN